MSIALGPIMIAGVGLLGLYLLVKYKVRWLLRIVSHLLAASSALGSLFFVVVVTSRSKAWSNK